MRKAQVTEMEQVKYLRFFQMKQKLVKSLEKIILSSYSREELQSNKKDFERRVKVNVPEAFFFHWLFFFHRDCNGKRGIEIFNESCQDEPQLKERAEKWTHMVPLLLQQVDYNDQGVFMEDLFTNARYFMPYCETMQKWVPWAGTFCMLEEFDGGFYLNGVAATVSPDQLGQAFTFINQQITETGQPYQKVVFECYPEILQELLTNPDMSQKKHEIIRTELHYHVENLAEVAQSFKDKGRFQMNRRDENSTKGNFVKKLYRYEDNLAPAAITLAEIGGDVEVDGHKFVYRSLNHEDAIFFKNSMFSVQGAALVDEVTEKLEVPVETRAVVHGVKLHKGVPEEFAYVAQQASLRLETDQPQSLFDGLTPEEMVAGGKGDMVEQWLRQHEYTSYLNLKNTVGEVKTTPDFNAIRKKLGLKLSPFVTMRENRQTNLILEFPMGNVLRENVDLSLMEEIGIPLEEANQFYVKDILEFFKEKAAGKSQSTYYKYRLGLQTIGYFLSQKQLASWSDINRNDWEKWLAFNYLVFNMDVTMSQVKGFMTVLKSFMAKVDEIYGVEQSASVREIEKELEPTIIAAVKALEGFATYQERRFDPEFDMDHLYELIHSAPVITDYFLKGVFQVKEVHEKGVNIHILGYEDSSYYVTMDGKHLDNIEQGMILVGGFVKEKEWKVSKINRIFPPQANKAISVVAR